MATFTRRTLLLALIALTLFFFGCDKPPEEETGEPSGPQEVSTSPQPTMRIVSLAPALTQMVVDMGHANLLVGVAEHDDAAPKGLPVVGNYQTINSEALLALKPTHVLLMTGKEGPPARLTELAAAKKFDLVTYPSPTSVTEIGNILFNEDEPPEEAKKHPTLPSLGAVLEDGLTAWHVKVKMLVQLGQVADAAAQGPKQRVLLVIGTNPIGASGPKTVLDELLRRIGASNAIENARGTYITLDKEKLLETKPDVILLVMPGAPPLESVDKDARLADLRGLDIPAVKNNQIRLISDPLALLPSSSLAHTAGEMAKAIHPNLVKEIDAAMIIKATATAPSEDVEPHAATEPSPAKHAP